MSNEGLDNEVKPNNNLESAEEIEENIATAENTVKRNSSKYEYIVDGTISKGDEDWFKVYLTSGTKYLTVNGTAFDVALVHPNGKEEKWSYTKAEFGATAYEFKAVSGYYYVRISGTRTGSNTYSMLIGNPVYAVGMCKVNLSTQTMKNGLASTWNIDLRNESVLPKDAMVYEIWMSNTSSSVAKEIFVKNRTTKVQTGLAMYTWSRYGLAYKNFPLMSQWEIKFTYNKDCTVSPIINFTYVYPVTSKYVEMNIEL